jgi:probable selenium-dependent hydroxylase accessory protein YqeC
MVGAGGKTTLMFALGLELAAPGKLVITTTTTKIFEPSTPQTQQLIVEENEDMAIKLLEGLSEKYRLVTVAKSRLIPNKLTGIRPEFVARLAGPERVFHIIIEADGASQRPLKAPNETEPVIPENTTLVVPVAGIDALGRPLNDGVVFRAHIAARLLDMLEGEIISPKIIARLITHEKGIIKGTPAKARIVPFINKVDSKADLEKAIEIAREILDEGHPKIDIVVVGAANKSGVCFVVTRD